jgi:hypothetical protein
MIELISVTSPNRSASGAAAYQGLAESNQQHAKHDGQQTERHGVHLTDQALRMMVGR